MILFTFVGTSSVIFWEGLLAKDSKAPLFTDQFVSLYGHASTPQRYIFMATITISKTRDGNQYVLLALDTLPKEPQVVRISLSRILPVLSSLSEATSNKSVRTSILFVKKILEDMESPYLTLLSKFPSYESTSKLHKHPSPSRSPSPVVQLLVETPSPSIRGKRSRPAEVPSPSCSIL